MDDIDRQRAHFESVSAEYLHARQQRTHLAFKRLLWAYFLGGKPSLLRGEDKVLEPMCGYAEGKTILETHYGRPIAYTGFDLSVQLVDEARKRYPDAAIFIQDVTQLSAAETYDLIILIGGLHHVYAHTSDVLSRLYKALKRGGHFISFEPTQNNSVFRYVRRSIYKANRIFDAETERAYEDRELNALYRSSGFEVVDQMYVGLLLYVMYYNPDAFPRLNRGSPRLVRALFSLEKRLYRTWLARKFSFATLSLLRKP